MSVSIVIPAYNRAKRLPATIESALRQGHDDLEIIVVDDGSVDDTREVLAVYGDRVRHVYQSNAGAGAARNTGIRHATKEFVAFLDSDDRWEDYKLSLQLAVLKARPEVGLVFSDFVIEKPDQTLHLGGAALWAGRALDFPDMAPLTLQRPASPNGARWPSEKIQYWAGPMYRQLLDELPILTSSVIVRRSALDQTTWYAEGVALFEDWEFFARVARRASVAYIDAPTTINSGHLDPGRVSKCSNVDRAASYRTLLERVWLADPEFSTRFPDPVRSAYGRALLAVAREALLAGRQSQAQDALDLWRQSSFTERRDWAAIYRVCARLAGGRVLLRNILRGRTALRLVTGAQAPVSGSVNPAV